MTNELEKQFFDTFGIEPKKGCTAYDKFTAEEADVICNDCCRACLYFDDVYPRITPEILLELICIANEVYIDLEGTDIETMKNSLLENFIFFRRDVKHQVRTLFEEG